MSALTTKTPGSEAGGDTGLSDRRNRPAIMSQQDSAFEGRPFQHLGIERSCQVDVANVNKVQRQSASRHPVHDVFIEVPHARNDIGPFRGDRSRWVHPLVDRSPCVVR